jgi:hypothetical protein
VLTKEASSLLLFYFQPIINNNRICNTMPSLFPRHDGKRLNLSAQDFFEIGMKQILNQQVGAHESSRRKFVSTFGTDPIVVAVLWKLLSAQTPYIQGCKPQHLLWALMFMKLYSKETVLAVLSGSSEKTLRKWVWYFLRQISSLVPHVVSEFETVHRCLSLFFRFTHFWLD